MKVGLYKKENLRRKFGKKNATLEKEKADGTENKMQEKRDSAIVPNW